MDFGVSAFKRHDIRCMMSAVSQNLKCNLPALDYRALF